MAKPNGYAALNLRSLFTFVNDPHLELTIVDSTYGGLGRRECSIRSSHESAPTTYQIPTL